MMRKRIYISGPLTSSGNVNENLERAMGAARALVGPIISQSEENEVAA